jgi:autotransporter-associated beta strand protein
MKGKIMQIKSKRILKSTIATAVFFISAILAHGNPIPPVAFSVDSQHASDKRNYQGVPSVAVTPAGRLWAVWYAGPKGEDIYNYVIASTSADGGKTWGEKFVIDPDGDGPVRACNPVFWRDPNGKLWLFWCQFPDSKTTESLVYAMTTENSDDENPKWSAPRVLCPGVTQNKPIVTHQGVWLLPVANWHHEGSNMIMFSDDNGEKWSLRGSATVPDPSDRNCDEPMIVELSEGSLLMLVRTKYGIGRSFSSDGGRSWDPVVPSGLPHTPARLYLSRLRSGNLLLVKHGPLEGAPVGRKKLQAYLSKDDGKTWGGGLMIDERSVSYPDGDQAADGTIYIIHDRERYEQREIILNTFTEEDVIAGNPVSGKARFNMLINRAIGPEVPWKKDEAIKASTEKTVPATVAIPENKNVEVWVGRGTGNNWRIPENWADGSFPMSGAKLVFSGTSRTSPNNNNKPGMKISGITFAPDAGAFKVTGTAVNPIELAGEIVNESKFTQVLCLPIVFSGEQVIYANTGDIRIEGQISGGCTLVKTGESTLILAAENDYKGITHVKSGTLRAETATLPAHGEIRIEGPGFLELAFKGVNSTKTLYISGEKQAKGVWGAIGSDADLQNPHITGTGTLKVLE